MKKTTIELMAILDKQKGFMGVDFDRVVTPEDLFENVKDEICSFGIALDGGYEEDLWGMTPRQAKGYITRMENFLKKYDTE